MYVRIFSLTAVSNLSLLYLQPYFSQFENQERAILDATIDIDGVVVDDGARDLLHRVSVKNTYSFSVMWPDLFDVDPPAKTVI
jgi:hypothetical protein